MSYAMMEQQVTSNRLARDLDSILARTEPLWHELRGQRILITGASGFFGCWLLESFAWANRRLNLSASAVAVARRPLALMQTAPHLVNDSAVTVHAADVRHDAFPEGNFSHVIHAATEASAAVNRQTPLAMFDTIVNGTRRALDFSVANSVAKFLYISSGAVYGTQPSHVTHVAESFRGGPDPLDPASAYAEGKRAAELLCALAASPQFETKIARCFAFVGPYMKLDAHFAVGNFIGDCLNHRPISLQGNGSAVRSYMYASDLMVWLWTILFAGQPSRAYNVGSEEAINIAALAGTVAAAVAPGVEINIPSAATPGAEVHRYVPSTARAREEMSLNAEVPLREAICRTYDWFSETSSSGQKAFHAAVGNRGSAEPGMQVRRS
jgi:nucleoside-diphosphate-sugar epimerase